MSDDILQNIGKKYLDRYQGLLDQLNIQTIKGTKDLLDKAFLILVERRKDKKIFYKKDLILSVLDASQIAVREIGLGYTSIISLFLYHAYSKEEIDVGVIKKTFGNPVAIITDGLTKVSKINKETSSSQAENFRKLLLNLCNFIHSLRTNLNLNPSAFRTNDCGMQRLITICFGHRYPVAQS
ncbi:hypothetical protein ES708_31439 [subsurface metagenome]